MSGLTEEERDAEVKCECGHRVLWHHDTRGCGFHGYGPNRCACSLPHDIALMRLLARHRAEAWDEGYGKGNLDGYFGTSDEWEKNPCGVTHRAESDS